MPLNNPDTDIRYPSMASLRAAHRDLLILRRNEGETTDFFEAVKTFVQKGKVSGAILDADSDRRATQSLLDYWGNILYINGGISIDVSLDIFDPQLAPDLSDDQNPYQGLDAFQESEHGLFFGRQSMVASGLRHLATHRFLALIGPTGSGKSSIVMAGLLPELKKGQESQYWRYSTRIVPGSRPLENLASALWMGSGDQQAWVQEQVELLLSNDEHLHELISRQVGRNPAVLVIDQFEEVFTLCTDENRRQAYINNLITFAEKTGLRHTLILTMRTEYENQAARYEKLHSLLQKEQLRMVALNAGELRDAILKPAELIGLKFEEGLVDDLIRSVIGEPAALPLLQFTLLRLWQMRERNRITLEAYRRLGGGRQALANSADEVYEDLIPEEQVTARRILLRLVRPGEGLEVTTHRLLHKDLYTAGEARDRIDRVLKRLIDERLLRVTGDIDSGDAQIEVAHEALVRNWPRLFDWLEDERVTLRRRLRLTTAAEQWQSLGKDPNILWRGQILAEALEYEDLTELEHKFVQACQEAVEAERKAKEEARQRELAQAKALAEEQSRLADAKARTTRRLRVLTALLFVLFIGAGVAAVYAIRNWTTNQSYANQAAEYAQQEQNSLFEAEQARDLAREKAIEARESNSAARENLVLAERALDQARFSLMDQEEALAEARQAQSEAEILASQDRSRAIAATSIANLRNDQQLSLLLALEAVRSAQTPEALDALHRATRIFQVGIDLYNISMEFDETTQIIFSTDNRYIAQILTDPKTNSFINVWSFENGDQVRRLRLPYPLPSFPTPKIAAGPDFQTLAIVLGNTTLELRDGRTGNLYTQISNIGSRGITSLAFHPDQARIAVMNSENVVQVRDIQSGVLMNSLVDPGTQRQIVHGIFNQSGDWLATINRPGVIKIWDFEAGTLLKELQGNADSSAPIFVFDNDNALLAAKLDSRTAGVWELSGGTLKNSLKIETGEITALDFNPDGTQLAIGNLDGSITFMDVESGKELRTAHSAGSAIRVIDFSLGENALQTLNDLGVSRLWFVDSTDQALIFPGTTIRFNPQKAQHGSIDFDGKAGLWDTTTGSLIFELNSDDNEATALAFKPDGSQVAVAYNNGTVLLWNTESGAIEAIFNRLSELINALAYQPDGSTLAIAGQDGSVLLVDLATSSQTAFSSTDYNYAVTSLSFSPDGALLAGADSSGVIRLWDRASGEVQRILAEHQAAILGLVFSPDGKRLASAGYDSRIVLWDVERERPYATAQDFLGAITDLAYVPDGSLLVSSGADGFARFWNVEDGSLAYAIGGYGSALNSLDISEDGEYLAVGGVDGMISLDILSFEQLMSIAESHITRQLTEDECQRYMQSQCPVQE